MANRTLTDEIITIIQSEANNNPAPTTCTITKNYPNEPGMVDVTTNNGDYRYIPCLHSNTIGRTGILIFLNGDLNTPIAIIETRSI